MHHLIQSSPEEAQWCPTAPIFLSWVPGPLHVLGPGALELKPLRDPEACPPLQIELKMKNS